MPTNVALTGLAHDLAKREAEDRPVRIGLLGAGEMGTDIVTRVAHMRGVKIGAICELNVPAAEAAVDIAHREADHSRVVASTGALGKAMDDCKPAITDDVSIFLD